MGALDRPTSGSVTINGEDVSGMSETALAALRNRFIGFVFQNFFLLPYYSALENVCVPLMYENSYEAKKSVAKKLLDYVGLSARMDHKPRELSGGEQQRVAIARALINQPALLCADEPTGNLDSNTGDMVMGFIKEINQNGTTVLLITHDLNVAKKANRILHMKDGQLHDRQ